MPDTDALVNALRGIQRANAWTDQQMADAIGTTRQHWAYLRLDQQQPGVDTLRKIAAAFPFLRDAVHNFVGAPATKVAEKDASAA